MKNIKQIFNYSFLMILSIATISCDSDDDDVNYTVGNSLALLQESQISFFDVDSPLTFNIAEFSASTALTGLEVLIEDVSIANASIEDDVTATFRSSALLPFEFDVDGAVINTGAIDLVALSTEANGEVGTSGASLDVVKPLSFSNEVSTVIYGDTTLENSEITFNVFTAGAVVDDVTVSWKNGSDGTYVVDTSKIFSVEEGGIDLNDLDYIGYGLEVGDILFYQFTATSGDLVDTIETSVVITPQTFGEPISISMSSASPDAEFNLASGAEVNELSVELGEITFADIQGFTTLEGVEFVKLADSGAEFYAEYSDVDQAKSDFETGTSITTTQVEAGDIYVYEATRDDVVSYGAILIGDVVIVNAGESISFDLTIKENIEIIIEQ